MTPPQLVVGIVVLAAAILVAALWALTFMVRAHTPAKTIAQIIRDAEAEPAPPLLLRGRVPRP